MLNFLRQANARESGIQSDLSFLDQNIQDFQKTYGSLKGNFINVKLRFLYVYASLILINLGHGYHSSQAALCFLSANNYLSFIINLLCSLLPD